VALTRDLRDDQAEHDRGARIAGRYRVDRLIARGGMATVYLATHVDLNRPIALKVLRPPDDAENASDFAERFRLEALTLAALDHPNIVTLHDFGELPDERWFLAMEFIDGPRLSDVMRQGPIEPQRALALLLQVCSALRYAHGRGVIHRDLKPSNLMIQRLDDGTEHVKVVDFGIVKLSDAEQSLTRAGLILGSPHCMSPEQVRGSDVDVTADVYAIGVLLYRAVTGKYPFHGPNSAATMMAHLHNEVPSFYSIDPDMQVPEGLEAVVRTCLQKEPAARYPSMDALTAALLALTDAPPELYRTLAPSFTRPAPVKSEPSTAEVTLAEERERDRRFLLGGVLGAVVLAALGVGLGWAAVSAMRESDPAAEARSASAPAALHPAAPPANDARPTPTPTTQGSTNEAPTPDVAPTAAPPANPTPTAAPPSPAPPTTDAAAPRSPTPAPRATPKPAAATTERPPTAAPAASPTPAPPAAPNPDGYKGLPEDW
jgi:tRNA A-37 threonylcarbamoyl transferase component Bud32